MNKVKSGAIFIYKGEEWRVNDKIPPDEVFEGQWNCTEISTGDDGIWLENDIYAYLNGETRDLDIEEPSALDTQIGGDHYKTMPIQPMEYSMKNGLDACQHTIIKYVTRFREKGGIEDLEKAKHCIDLLIGFEREHEND